MLDYFQENKCGIYLSLKYIIFMKITFTRMNTSSFSGPGTASEFQKLLFLEIKSSKIMLIGHATEKCTQMFNRNF